MYKYITHFSLFAVLAVSVSCNTPIKKQLRRLMKREVVIPHELGVIQKGEDSASLIDHPGAVAKLIVYIDSLSCSNCGIDHLYEYDSIVQLQRELDHAFVTLFIFSPKKSEVHDVHYAIRASSFGYPVFLDSTGRFPLANPHIPANFQLHTFLLDKNGFVVLSGNPIRNRTLWALYKKTIRQLIDNGGTLSKDT